MPDKSPGLTGAMRDLGETIADLARNTNADLGEGDPLVNSFNEVTQPIKTVAEPMARGFGRIFGRDGERGDRRERLTWYRRFLSLFRDQHREDVLLQRRQDRTLKNIERKPGAEKGMPAWLSLLLAPLASIVGLLGGLGGKLVAGLAAALAPILAKLGLGRLASRLPGGRAPAVAAGGRGAPAGAGGGGRGAPAPVPVGGKGTPTPDTGQAGAPKRGWRNALRRARGIPGLGALLGIGFMANDVYASETAPEATRAEKDATTGRAIGGGVGALGGAWAGGAAGAALGSVVPIVGTAIGGIIGALAGAYFGGSAGEAVGTQVGGWVNELRGSDLVATLSDKWQYAVDFTTALTERAAPEMAAVWAQTTAAFSSGWDATRAAMEATWQTLSATVAAAWTDVSSWFKTRWDEVAALSEAAWDGITERFAGVSDWAREQFTKVASAFDGVAGWMKETWGKVTEWVSDKAGALNAYVAEKTGVDVAATATDVASRAGDLWNRAKGATGRAMATVGGWVDTAKATADQKQQQRKMAADGGGSLYGLISRGESGAAGYDAYNRGTSGGKILGATGARDLQGMTIAEIQAAQALPVSDPRRLFAVGKYQMIPDTLAEGVSALGLDTGTKFDQATQDALFAEWLLGKKRPDIQKYITGQSDNLQAAQLAGAKEWASIADPTTGKSVYGSGNEASITADQFGAALTSTRERYLSLVQSGVDDKTAYRQAVSTMPTAAPTIDETALAKDLGAGGALRKAASASADTGGMADVPTLAQATEAGALAAPASASQAGAAQAKALLESRRAGRHVDVSNLDAGMAANLANFIAEAEQEFGRKLKVQSAYRPPTAQEKAALGSSGSTQAGLGKGPLVASTYGSMHGRGEAADLKFADMGSIKDMNAMSQVDQEKWFALARKHNLNLPMLQGAKGPGTGRQGGPLEWWHVEPGQVAGGRRGDMGLRGDQYVQRIRSRSLDAAVAGAPTINETALAKDLGAGGALRQAATASVDAGMVSDVHTLAQATEASSIVAPRAVSVDAGAAPDIPAISTGGIVAPRTETEPASTPAPIQAMGWIARLLAQSGSPAAQAAGDLLSGGSGAGLLGRLTAQLPAPLQGLGGFGGLGDLLSRLGVSSPLAGQIPGVLSEVAPQLGAAADRLLQVPGSLGASVQAGLSSVAQSGISAVGGLAGQAIQPLAAPLDALGGMAQSGISAVDASLGQAGMGAATAITDLAGMATRPLAAPISAIPRAFSAIMPPQAAAPAAPPPEVKVPLALGSGGGGADLSAAEVTRDVSDRRIAHIVTGAYSSGGL